MPDNPLSEIFQVLRIRHGRRPIRQQLELHCFVVGRQPVSAVAGAVLRIYTSINSGITWTPASGLLAAQWRSIASSADGSKLVAAINGGEFTRISRRELDGDRSWFCELDFSGFLCERQHLISVAVSVGAVYTSSNSGGTWTAVTGGANWVSVVCSADGSKFAVPLSVWITVQEAPEPSSANWVSVTSSADGNRLAAAVGGGGN